MSATMTDELRAEVAGLSLQEKLYLLWEVWGMLKEYGYRPPDRPLEPPTAAVVAIRDRVAELAWLDQFNVSCVIWEDDEIREIFENAPIPPDVIAELERSEAEYRANPGSALSLEETMAELRADLGR